MIPTSLPYINLWKLYCLWLAVIILLELNASKQPVMKKVIAESAGTQEKVVFKVSD